MQTEAAVRALKRRHSPALLGQPGISGVGVEKADDGGCILTVHLAEDSPAVRAAVRKVVGDIPVRLSRSGPFRALPAKG